MSESKLRLLYQPSQKKSTGYMNTAYWWHVLSDLRTSHWAPPPKVPPPTKSATLGTKPLLHGPVGDIKTNSQTIERVKLIVKDTGNIFGRCMYAIVCWWLLIKI